MGIFRSLRRPLGGFMVDDGERDRERERERDRGDRHEAEVERAVENRLGHLTRKLEKIMHTLEEVLDLVRAQKTKIDSLNSLMDGIRQQIKDALGGTVTPSMQMRIDQVFDAAKDNADALDEAITENTVGATSGAVTDGPSFGEIKSDANTAVDPPGGAVDSTAEKVVDPQPATSEK